VLKTNSYWIRSGFFTLLERLSVMLLGFGSVYILFRVLSKADFGVWVVYLTFISILEVSRAGLLQNALVKFLTTSEKETYQKIATAALILNGLVTLGSVVLLLTVAQPLSLIFEMPKLAPLLYIYCFTTIGLMPFFQFNYMQQANLSFRGIFFGQFTKQGTLFIFLLLGFMLGWTIELLHLAYVQILGAGLATLISWLFGRRFIHFSKKISLLWVKRLFHYGKFILGTNISTMLYKSVDKFMLGIVLPGGGKVAIAIYEAAIKVTNMTEVPTLSMASILFPQSARRQMQEGVEGLKMLYEKAVGAVFAVLLPAIVVVLLAADWIILFIAGPEYTEAANLLRITILYGLFTPFSVQFGTVLDSTGRAPINFRFNLLGAGLNILSNFLFISQFGLIGAAYGTLTTFATMFVLMQIYLNRQFGVRTYRAFYYVLYFYKKIVQTLYGWSRKQMLRLSES